jgi:iron only hydrogenase large subunit-like protein
LNGISEYHSVELQDDRCKGCTICVTACPVEAIRVHGGKAHILEEKCIDCGECIRVCPNRAKYAITNTIKDISPYKKSVVLTDPTLYAQFNERFTEQDIEQALQSLGFSSVYKISDTEKELSKVATIWLQEHFNKKDALRPIISSSCPAVVRLIQVRFPSLIEHLLPLISPAEVCAKKARKENDTDTEIYFISPCPAKITITRSPLGYNDSQIDKVLNMEDLYLPILGALNKLPHINTNSNYKIDNQWCCSSGESQSINNLFLKTKKSLKWLNASGIKQTIDMLENAEDGTLGNFDFLELNICQGGCIGGPLTINPQPVAEALLRRYNPEKSENSKTLCNNTENILANSDISSYLFTSVIIPRPSRLLSNNFAKARKMMEEIESTLDLLPGFDCGSCGAPNCRALAEDIVRGNAKLDDCVFVMKRRYEDLLFGNKTRN